MPASLGHDADEVNQARRKIDNTPFMAKPPSVQPMPAAVKTTKHCKIPWTDSSNIMGALLLAATRRSNLRHECPPPHDGPKEHLVATVNMAALPDDVN